MRTNSKYHGYSKTHEGAVSPVLSPEQQLRRTVMSCMLFEDNFYENGEDSADRIKLLVKEVPFSAIADIAIEAREKMKLRHVPLLLIREALRYHKGRQVGDLITRVIQRPDELTELLAIYWKDGKKPLANQLKIGLARAMKKFDAYQLAKWNRADAIKLRDVLFLSHSRPQTPDQENLFRGLANDTLESPETWEVQLSRGDDKRQVFEGLIKSNKLGALALLRNLRGMLEAGVSEDLIRESLTTMKVERVLPFRFITAARYAPRLEDALESAMFKGLEGRNKLPGKTALLIDHSSSMQQLISSKSEISRFDAAAALAMVLAEVCDRLRVFTFSDQLFEVPPRRGFALIEAVEHVIRPMGTLLGLAVRGVYKSYPECDRMIVITDEQSSDRPPHPQGKGYIINVAPYKQGIGYGPWVTINGWSEAVLDYIETFENFNQESDNG